ncbi:MAG: benzoyl-CoA 2,3-epoxidase subunit [Thermoplasmata archaeon]|jgi:benzoyl-CoA 2,3-dioxygenase component B|nr:benzoyl-CoA 2,3-epoxidase subunit [Thermoplasmata archaeon]
MAQAASVPTTFDDWVAQFGDWQKKVGFDTAWLGDYRFEAKYDFDNVAPHIEYGDYKGRPKWERPLQIPHQNIRDALMHLITVQGDTEFASVEQQRHLLASAPTEYDRKSALRIMAEEQRHGWQMCHLLMTHFGPEGAREAQKLLQRDANDGNRLLGSFNEPTKNWLDFFVFTMFVDRDGKYQLKMLSTSAFKPLAASMGPMLKEEAFHLGTGSNGLRRIVKAGVIPIPVLQRSFNRWIPTAYDLFGKDGSTSSEWAYVWGLKGRYDEAENTAPVDKRMLNRDARELYRQEIAREVEIINKSVPDGQPKLYVPAPSFHRAIGPDVGAEVTPAGEAWKGKGSYADYLATVLPTKEDDDVLAECFKREWIASKAA